MKYSKGSTYLYRAGQAVIICSDHMGNDGGVVHKAPMLWCSQWKGHMSLMQDRARGRAGRGWALHVPALAAAPRNPQLQPCSSRHGRAEGLGARRWSSGHCSRLCRRRGSSICPRLPKPAYPPTQLPRILQGPQPQRTRVSVPRAYFRLGRGRRACSAGALYSSRPAPSTPRGRRRRRGPPPSRLRCRCRPPSTSSRWGRRG